MSASTIIVNRQVIKLRHLSVGISFKPDNDQTLQNYKLDVILSYVNVILLGRVSCDKLLDEMRK